MTDIDALIAALRNRHVEELTSLGRDPDKYCSVLSSAADALTTERAKLTSLQAVAHDLLEALTTERAKVAEMKNKLSHIRLIEHDTSSSHSEKLGEIFRIARAGTSDHYPAPDTRDNPERETVGDAPPLSPPDGVAKGGDNAPEMLTLTRSDLEIELARLKAEAARWREVAGELAGVLEKIDDWFPNGIGALAALARYSKMKDPTHD